MPPPYFTFDDNFGISLKTRFEPMFTLMWQKNLAVWGKFPQVIPALQQPFQNSVAIDSPPESSMTVVQRKTLAVQKKSVNPVLALGNGLWDGLFKPYKLMQRGHKALTAPATTDTELHKLFSQYGFTFARTAAKYVVNPEAVLRIAENQAVRAEQLIRTRLYALPWQMVTLQISPFAVLAQAKQLHEGVQVARREAATFRTDAASFYDATYNYYLYTKAFEFLGGFIAGAGYGLVTKRYLSAPSERYLGPTFGRIASGLTLPFRAVLPRSVAVSFGRKVAARSPAAIIMMLSWMGTLYNTRDEFNELIVDTKNAYPDVYDSVIREMDSMQK